MKTKLAAAAGIFLMAGLFLPRPVLSESQPINQLDSNRFAPVFKACTPMMDHNGKHTPYLCGYISHNHYAAAKHHLQRK